MKFLRYTFHILLALFVLLAPMRSEALTCEDVKYVDSLYNYQSALYTYLGCQEFSKENIQGFRESEIDLIKDMASRLFYANPQPRLLPYEVYSSLVEDATLEKEFFSLLYADEWSDFLDTDDLRAINLDFFSLVDPVARDLGLTILAAKSLLEPNDVDYQWVLPEFEAIGSLMGSQEIPYFSDYLSYAYINGYGVAVNFDEYNRLTEYASKTMPEAQRYKGMNLIDVDLEAGLNLVLKSADSGYISAIIDYVDTLIERENFIPQSEEKILSFMPVLEKLAYSGESSSQRLLGDLYSTGDIVDYSEERAVSWYSLAADQGIATAADYLVEYYSAQGNYAKVAKYLTLSADIGYVWEHGYFELLHSIMLSENDWESPQKLLEYVKFHCLNNQYVGELDRDVCKNYPVKNATFEKFLPLVDVIEDVSLIKYLDELNLSTGKYLALVIGNQKYENWLDLETPSNDVKNVSNLLRDEYNFEVTKLENASRRDMLQAIYTLGSEANFNDHVLVYYAGHGIVDESTNEGYWIPSNADKSFRPDWVSNSEIKTALKSINSRHLLVMADSCYSGTIIRSGAMVNDDISNALLERLFAKKAKIAITSGGNEPVADSTSGSDMSIFALAFTDALKQNSNKFVAASSLFSTIRDKVSKEANQTPQYANIRELDDDGGEFVFKKSP